MIGSKRSHWRPIVSGFSECTVSNQLLATQHDASYLIKSPWFSGAVEGIQGDEISLVNTTERHAGIAVLLRGQSVYTFGGAPGAPQLAFVCSQEDQVQIPPYAARQFPVRRDDSAHSSIRTQGDAIVLQMHRPLETGVAIYAVDSTVKFDRDWLPVNSRIFQCVRRTTNRKDHAPRHGHF